MTNAQQNTLRLQFARLRDAQLTAQREAQVFEQMAFLVDERLANPETGVRLDLETMTIVEPTTETEDAVL